MKKFAFLLFGSALAIWMTACHKDAGTDYQQLDDQALATAISEDRGKQEIDPSTLPAEILNVVETDYFDTYIDAVYFADGKGYDVVFANDEHAYFNLNRRILRHRLNDRIGPCGRLMGGEIVAVDSLRPAIVDYIHTHYPDAQILRAKRKGDRLFVLIGGHIILVFSGDGVFELDGRYWFDCRDCAPTDIANVPASVKSQIETRIPGGEIKRICRRGDRFVLAVVAGDQRHILVYDKDWNFLFAIP